MILGVDEVGVDEMGVDETESRGSGMTPLSLLLEELVFMFSFISNRAVTLQRIAPTYADV